MQGAFRSQGGRLLSLLACGAVAAALTLPAGAAAPPAAAQTGPYVETPPPYLTPFPVVRVIGRLTNRGARIILLRVKAPARSQVRVFCDGGRRRGCPYASRTFAVKAGRVTVGSMQRSLVRGARIRVYVRKGNTIGKYTAFRIRLRRVPLRADSCLFPGLSKPRRCP